MRVDADPLPSTRFAFIEFEEVIPCLADFYNRSIFMRFGEQVLERGMNNDLMINEQ